MTAAADLEELAFPDRAALRAWLVAHHDRHPGGWVRLSRAGSSVPSVSFTDLLEEGLCFGWSESTRRAGDARTYLQRFTPRRTSGTVSERNLRLVTRLAAEGAMTPDGYRALALEVPPGASPAL